MPPQLRDNASVHGPGLNGVSCAGEEAGPTPKKLRKASSLPAHRAGTAPEAAPEAAPSSPGLEDISDAEDDARLA